MSRHETSQGRGALALHVTSVRSNLIVFAILMALLGLTVAIAYLDLGRVGLVIALVIASIKAVLIVLYFMHIRFSSRLQRLFACGALFWLAVLILITYSDYLSRGVLGVFGK